jgi:hypothetical protein
MISLIYLIFFFLHDNWLGFQQFINDKHYINLIKLIFFILILKLIYEYK